MSPETRRAVAECNFEFGEVLAGNKAAEAAVPKLRKAYDTYRELAGSTKPAPADPSPAAFEQALKQLAMNAAPELRMEIEAELARFGR